MAAAKPLILVDGSSYLFRAYYALPPLMTKTGMPTGAMYGVLNMLRKLVNDYKPLHIAVVFDPKGKTFRHDLYPGYKANRTQMPDDLQQQIAPLHRLIRGLGFPLIIVEGIEADDVIGTLAHQAEQQGLSVLISTGDKDMAQLVNENITLINTMTGSAMDIKGVKQKFGVSPDKIIDYLALMGDSVDNIPGVPNVGPKTAAKWLDEFGSLENVMQAAPQMKGKVGENLRRHLGELPLSRELVTIKKDINVAYDVQTLRLGDPDKTLLMDLFLEYEFKNWLAELTLEPKVTKPEHHYEIVMTEQHLDQWIKQLKQKKQFAFDTETTSLQAISAELVGVSFSVEPGKAAYVPVAHDYEGAPLQLDRNRVLAKLKPLLTDSQNTLIGHNIKYDMEVLMNYGIELKTQLLDTLIESYVINSTATRHDMDSLAAKHLGRKTLSFEDVAGKGAKQKTFNQIALEVAANYAAEDADVTLALHEKLSPTITSEKGLSSVFTSIDMPLVALLARMEYHGVLIDSAMLEKQSAFLAKRIAELQQQAYQSAGMNFNLSSPKQLQEILFEKLKLPVLKKTPGGQASTAENILQDLALNYPLPKIILEYRSLSKLKSTYTDKLPLQVNAKTGRVHTSYNQAVTATGRLSSNNPNLQNIPIRTEEGRRIRQAFIAPKGCKIISADYSQIELRIIAHVSQDPGLLKAFKNGLDVHRATAAEVFGVAFDQVSDDQRRHAKTINFGLLYGMSAFGLSKNLGIDRHSAQEYMDIYFKRYPNVHQYMETTCEFARKYGYVESIFGRRIYIPDIQSSNIPRKKAAERAAINAPMQSSAADIIKKAMLCVDDWIQTSAVPVKMIMQVHDELVLEVESAFVEVAVSHLRHCMEEAVTLSVPLTVDIGIGENWDEAH